MRILFVASECAPYAKVGGLADVVAALPKTLHRLGHDVRVVLPLYGAIDRAKHAIRADGAAQAKLGAHARAFGVYAAMLEDRIPIWFVDYQHYFDRDGIYHDRSGSFADNGYRFALLCQAALQICHDREFFPDIVHVHDWPTALLPVYLKNAEGPDSPLSATASVLTIHNIGYQGKFDRALFFDELGLDDGLFRADVFEDHGQVNLLKAGIRFADAITTVSPTHREEILHTVGGKGLSPFLELRQDDLHGILNGADYDHWDPSKDPLLPARFDADEMSGKAICKTALQRRFELDQRADLPLFGIVSRLVPQKGIELLHEALPTALERLDMQFVGLGTGDPEWEEFFRWLRRAYPGQAGTLTDHSEELGHLIEAGSDFYLMPSLYEPCGLNQIYAMSYGTLPVVRATGGLKDTVRDYDEPTGNGTGFCFEAPTALALYDAISRVVNTWFDRPSHIARLRRAAMAMNFSWDLSAHDYLKVYRLALRRRESWH